MFNEAKNPVEPKETIDFGDWVSFMPGSEASFKGDKETFDPNGINRLIEKHPNCYSINNGIVAVVTEDKRMFVSPMINDIAARLKEAGFKNSDFFVPFSNGEVPFDRENSDKWKKLRTILSKEANA